MKKINIYYTLCGSKKEAQNLAKSLLEKNLAVCVNLINNVESFYLESNRVKSTNEIGLIIKSITNDKKIFSFIEKNHPYSIPFIVKFDSNHINEKYLKWALKSKNESFN